MQSRSRTKYQRYAPFIKDNVLSRVFVCFIIVNLKLKTGAFCFTS